MDGWRNGAARCCDKTKKGEPKRASDGFLCRCVVQHKMTSHLPTTRQKRQSRKGQKHPFSYLSVSMCRHHQNACVRDIRVGCCDFVLLGKSHDDTQKGKSKQKPHPQTHTHTHTHQQPRVCTQASTQAQRTNSLSCCHETGQLL